MLNKYFLCALNFCLLPFSSEQSKTQYFIYKLCGGHKDWKRGLAISCRLPRAPTLHVHNPALILLGFGDPVDPHRIGQVACHDSLGGSLVAYPVLVSYSQGSRLPWWQHIQLFLGSDSVVLWCEKIGRTSAATFKRPFIRDSFSPNLRYLCVSILFNREQLCGKHIA